MEEWKDVKGYERLYQVSNYGRVKSLGNGNSCNSIERILKTAKDTHGYWQVVLSKNGKQKTLPVHRLVAIAFIPNPNNLPCVNHKDENPLNNNVDNLEWCTYSYNSTYSIGKPVVQYTKDGLFVAEFESIQEAERQTDGYHSHIVQCCKGKLKTHKGFIWKYKNEGN